MLLLDVDGQHFGDEPVGDHDGVIIGSAKIVAATVWKKLKIASHRCCQAFGILWRTQRIGLSIPSGHRSIDGGDCRLVQVGVVVETYLLISGSDKRAASNRP